MDRVFRRVRVGSRERTLIPFTDTGEFRIRGSTVRTSSHRHHGVRSDLRPAVSGLDLPGPPIPVETGPLGSSMTEVRL